MKSFQPRGLPLQWPMVSMARGAGTSRVFFAPQALRLWRKSSANSRRQAAML